MERKIRNFALQMLMLLNVVLTNNAIVMALSFSSSAQINVTTKVENFLFYKCLFQLTTIARANYTLKVIINRAAST